MQCSFEILQFLLRLAGKHVELPKLHGSDGCVERLLRGACLPEGMPDDFLSGLLCRRRPRERLAAVHGFRVRRSELAGVLLRGLGVSLHNHLGRHYLHDLLGRAGLVDASA